MCDNYQQLSCLECIIIKQDYEEKLKTLEQRFLVYKQKLMLTNDLIHKYSSQCKENSTLQQQLKSCQSLLKQYKNKLVASLSKHAPLEKELEDIKKERDNLAEKLEENSNIYKATEKHNIQLNSYVEDLKDNISEIEGKLVIEKESVSNLNQLLKDEKAARVILEKKRLKTLLNVINLADFMQKEGRIGPQHKRMLSRWRGELNSTENGEGDFSEDEGIFSPELASVCSSRDTGVGSLTELLSDDDQSSVTSVSLDTSNNKFHSALNSLDITCKPLATQKKKKGHPKKDKKLSSGPVVPINLEMNNEITIGSDRIQMNKSSAVLNKTTSTKTSASFKSEVTKDEGSMMSDSISVCGGLPSLFDPDNPLSPHKETESLPDLDFSETKATVTEIKSSEVTCVYELEHIFEEMRIPGVLSPMSPDTKLLRNDDSFIERNRGVQMCDVATVTSVEMSDMAVGTDDFIYSQCHVSVQTQNFEYGDSVLTSDVADRLQCHASVQTSNCACYSTFSETSTPLFRTSSVQTEDITSESFDKEEKVFLQNLQENKSSSYMSSDEMPSKDFELQLHVDRDSLQNSTFSQSSNIERTSVTDTSSRTSSFSLHSRETSHSSNSDMQAKLVTDVYSENLRSYGALLKGAERTRFLKLTSKQQNSTSKASKKRNTMIRHDYKKSEKNLKEQLEKWQSLAKWLCSHESDDTSDEDYSGGEKYHSNDQRSTTQYYLRSRTNRDQPAIPENAMATSGLFAVEDKSTQHDCNDLQQEEPKNASEDPCSALDNFKWKKYVPKKYEKDHGPYHVQRPRRTPEPTDSTKKDSLCSSSAAPFVSEASMVTEKILDPAMAVEDSCLKNYPQPPVPDIHHQYLHMNSLLFQQNMLNYRLTLQSVSNGCGQSCCCCCVTKNSHVGACMYRNHVNHNIPSQEQQGLRNCNLSSCCNNHTAPGTVESHAKVTPAEPPSEKSNKRIWRRIVDTTDSSESEADYKKTFRNRIIDSSSDTEDNSTLLRKSIRQNKLTQQNSKSLITMKCSPLKSVCRSTKRNTGHKHRNKYLKSDNLKSKKSYHGEYDTQSSSVSKTKSISSVHKKKHSLNKQMSKETSVYKLKKTSNSKRRYKDVQLSSNTISEVESSKFEEVCGEYVNGENELSASNDESTLPNTGPSAEDETNKHPLHVKLFGEESDVSIKEQNAQQEVEIVQRNKRNKYPSQLELFGDMSDATSEEEEEEKSNSKMSENIKNENKNINHNSSPHKRKLHVLHVDHHPKKTRTSPKKNCSEPYEASCTTLQQNSKRKCVPTNLCLTVTSARQPISQPKVNEKVLSDNDIEVSVHELNQVGAKPIISPGAAPRKLSKLEKLRRNFVKAKLPSKIASEVPKKLLRTKKINVQESPGKELGPDKCTVLKQQTSVTQTDSKVANILPGSSIGFSPPHHNTPSEPLLCSKSDLGSSVQNKLINSVVENPSTSGSELLREITDPTKGEIKSVAHSCGGSSEQNSSTDVNNLLNNIPSINDKIAVVSPEREMKDGNAMHTPEILSNVNVHRNVEKTAMSVNPELDIAAPSSGTIAQISDNAIKKCSLDQEESQPLSPASSSSSEYLVIDDDEMPPFEVTDSYNTAINFPVSPIKDVETCTKTETMKSHKMQDINSKLQEVSCNELNSKPISSYMEILKSPVETASSGCLETNSGTSQAPANNQTVQTTGISSAETNISIQTHLPAVMSSAIRQLDTRNVKHQNQSLLFGCNAHLQVSTQREAKKPPLIIEQLKQGMKLALAGSNSVNQSKSTEVTHTSVLETRDAVCGFRSPFEMCTNDIKTSVSEMNEPTKSLVQFEEIKQDVGVPFIDPSMCLTTNATEFNRETSKSPSRPYNTCLDTGFPPAESDMYPQTNYCRRSPRSISSPLRTQDTDHNVIGLSFTGLNSRSEASGTELNSGTIESSLKIENECQNIEFMAATNDDSSQMTQSYIPEEVTASANVIKRSNDMSRELFAGCVLQWTLKEYEVDHKMKHRKKSKSMKCQLENKEFKMSEDMKKQEKKISKQQLQKLLSYDFNCENFKQVVDTFSQFETESAPLVLAKYVVQHVMEDFKDSLDYSCKPRAPPLTPSQQRLVTLILMLHQRHPQYKDLVQNVLLGIEYRLFRLGHSPKVLQICSLARFYASICRTLQYIERIRAFCFDALYCLYYKAFPLLFTVFLAYPAAMPHASLVKDSLLVTSITSVILTMSTTKIEPEYKIGALKDLLQTRFGYNQRVLSKEQLLEMLMDRIKSSDDDVEGLEASLILLAKRMGSDESYKKIICRNLIPLLDMWKTGAMSDGAAKQVIRAIGYITRSFPVVEAQACVQTVLNLLSDILLQPRVPVEVQEAAARSMLCLSRHNFFYISNTFVKWQPSQNISHDLQTELRSFVELRNPKWWNTFLRKKRVIKM